MEQKRNLWVIPTDEPSRLILRKDNKFILRTPITQWHGKNQNICITNDEKPKDGDYGLGFALGIKGVGRGYYVFKQDGTNVGKLNAICNGSKKIILTTDLDLIKDGVQAIDDEFLEWFVKNPSCEYIKTEKWLDDEGGVLYSRIIPKEEPKFEDSIENSINIMSISNSMFSKKEEPKQSVKEYEQQGLEKYSYELEQETLEEASKRAVKSGLFKDETLFVAGAKYQQEQDKNKYSEEEVIEFLNKREDYINQTSSIFDYITAKEWFEQFSKLKNG
jgi:hypothetical protein